MPGKDPGPSVKDDETYEELRKQGASKEKAARIANAKANGPSTCSETPSAARAESWSARSGKTTRLSRR